MSKTSPTPAPGSPEPPLGGRLDSWKEIAAYLKREVRTAQRWEKSEGLPVRRHQHDKLSSVFAYKSELDTWWHDRQPRLEKEVEPAVEVEPADAPENVPATNEITAADLRPAPGVSRRTAVVLWVVLGLAVV